MLDALKSLRTPKKDTQGIFGLLAWIFGGVFFCHVIYRLFITPVDGYLTTHQKWVHVSLGSNPYFLTDLGQSCVPFVIYIIFLYLYLFLQEARCWVLYRALQDDPALSIGQMTSFRGLKAWFYLWLVCHWMAILGVYRIYTTDDNRVFFLDLTVWFCLWAFLVQWASQSILNHLREVRDSVAPQSLQKVRESFGSLFKDVWFSVWADSMLKPEPKFREPDPAVSPLGGQTRVIDVEAGPVQEKPQPEPAPDKPVQETRTGPVKQQILDWAIKKVDWFSPRELEEDLKIKSKTRQRYTNELVGENRLEKDGSGPRNTKFRAKRGSLK